MKKHKCKETPREITVKSIYTLDGIRWCIFRKHSRTGMILVEINNCPYCGQVLPKE